MLKTNPSDNHEETFIHTHTCPTIIGWTELSFGRYHGKTLPQIAFIDPDYFFWAMEKDIFKTDQLKTEAELICKRAMRIKVPDAAVGKVKILYGVHPASGKLERVRIVPADFPKEDEGLSYWSDYFDLSVPRELCRYDKAGSKLVVKAVKKVVFDGARLTKARCEEFFNDPRNFACHFACD